MNLLLKRAPDFRGDHYDVLADYKVGPDSHPRAGGN
jgi:hypothetical protein